jgi:arginyl-tRNA synthetase
MVNSILREKIHKAVKEYGVEPPRKSRIKIEFPKHKKFGDYSTNIALSLAKKEKKSPMDIAKKLVTMLSKDSLFEKVTVEKPGFINFTLSREYLYKSLQVIYSQGRKCGSTPQKGNGKRVLIEFVSSNPTGPLNVVNARASALGESLANILSFIGYNVEKEFFINDAGHQIDVLAESVEYELDALESIEEEERDVDIEERYRGDYISDIAKELLGKEGKNLLKIPKKLRLEKIKEFAIASILADQKKTLEDFNVHFDSWVSEMELREKGSVEDVLAYLSETGNTYEQDNAVWFASSKFGDEKDRVIMKSDGEVTYLVPDIAYHITKFKRGFDKLIDIFGPDHHGHIPRLKAALKALGYDPSIIDFIILQQVNVLVGNEKLKMSKRAGNIVTLRELIDEVGTDAAHFFFLMRKYNTPLDFDIELAKKTSSENPVYYVQYAHARICSVEKRTSFHKMGIKDFKPEYLTHLVQEEELDIIRHLLKFPDLVLHIGANYDVNLLTTYLIGLAGLFHRFYQRFRILSRRSPELSLARLYLCLATKVVLRNGLELIGIHAPEEM